MANLKCKNIRLKLIIILVYQITSFLLKKLFVMECWRASAGNTVEFCISWARVLARFVLIRYSPTPDVDEAIPAELSAQHPHPNTPALK